MQAATESISSDQNDIEHSGMRGPEPGCNRCDAGPQDIGEAVSRNGDLRHLDDVATDTRIRFCETIALTANPTDECLLLALLRHYAMSELSPKCAGN